MLPGGSRSEALRSLYDRAQIERLEYDFFRALDSRDPAAAAALFTDDCEADFGPRAPRPSAHGRDEVERLIRDAFGLSSSDGHPGRPTIVRSSHHVSNISVSPRSADEADAQIYIFAWVQLSDGGVQFRFSITDDLLARSAAGWLIRSRRNRNLAHMTRPGR